MTATLPRRDYAAHRLCGSTGKVEAHGPILANGPAQVVVLTRALPGPLQDRLGFVQQAQEGRAMKRTTNPL